MFMMEYSCIETVTYPNGLVENYAYDTANRLLSIKVKNGSTLIEEFSYELDAASQMVGRNTNTGNSSFTFDALGRVTSELTPSVTTPSLTSYDDVGNLTSLNNVTQNFDVTGALISTSDGATDVTYEYNATGGRTTRAGPDPLTYDWDQSGKLKTLTSSDFTSSFVYNGDGLRKQKNS